MASFTFSCPYCGQKFEADESLIGQATVCPSCKNEIVVMEDIVYEDEYVALNKENDAVCPHCGRLLQANTENSQEFVLCSYCEKKFKTGKTIEDTSSEYSSEKNFMGSNLEVIQNYGYFQCYLCNHVYRDLKTNEGSRRICEKCQAEIFIEKNIDLLLLEKNFSVEKELYLWGSKLFIDDSHKILAFYMCESEMIIFVPFSKIIDWDSLTKESGNITGTVEGRMGKALAGEVVGELLGGPVGGIIGTQIGAAGERKINLRQEKKYKYGITIILDDLKISRISFTDIPEGVYSDLISCLTYAKYHRDPNDDRMVIAEKEPISYYACYKKERALLDERDFKFFLRKATIISLFGFAFPVICLFILALIEIYTLLGISVECDINVLNIVFSIGVLICVCCFVYSKLPHPHANQKIHNWGSFIAALGVVIWGFFSLRGWFS